MTDELVTIARFLTPLEADIVKARLEAADIPCVLTDQAMVSLGLPNAVGGTGLQVPSKQVARARAFLAADAAPEAPSGDVQPLTARERNADRAWRGALIGVLAWPLQWYVMWLLLKVLWSEERLDAAHRRRALIAAGISVLFGVVLFLFLFGALG